MTTAWGTGALSLSPWLPLESGRGKERVGGDWKLGAAGGAGEKQQDQLTTKLNLHFFVVIIIIIIHIIIIINN